MDVASSPTSALRTTGAFLPVANQSPDTGVESWIEPLRWTALAVFVAIPIFAYFVQALAGRVVWTVAVASLPLQIVLLGYHRWRRICPLAFFARLPARLGRSGRRRPSRWLQANYYYVAFAVFIVSLWLRLIATNGDGPALAAFLVLLSLTALAFGAAYTGKTWCNYLCPVSFIEKIYTEPRGLQDTPNSQCAKCTACKPACPDISQENGYWKEIASKPKRFVYFAFPGLIFSFYFYYYLQAGTWEYYFGGRWTDEPAVLQSAFLSGHDPTTAGFFFWPAVPRALAAGLTLALGALAGFGLFWQLERHLGDWWRQRALGMKNADVRHRMFTIAAFTAFLTFYTFAGAPTIRRIPWGPHFFQIIFVATATLFLARRLGRNPRAFAEETLARHIIRRWPWTDTKPPKSLHEAYLIHTIRSQSRASGYAQLLEIYQDAVREVVATGLVTPAELRRLESLRNQLQIHTADHEKVMAALEEEERARISDPSRQVSAEKRLQLETYARALASYLERLPAAQGAPDDSFILQLRREYGVTGEEHAAVLDELLESGQGPAGRLGEALGVVEGAASTVGALEGNRSAADEFLADLLRRRWERAVDDLLRAFRFAPEDETSRVARDGLLSSEEAARESAIQALGASAAPAIAERLLAARRQVAAGDSRRNTLAHWLRAHLSGADPYVRALALYALAERGATDQEMLRRLSGDEHPVVRETALCLSRQAGPGGGAAGSLTGLSTLETMIALRSVPIFSSLAPEELAELARSSDEKEYSPGEPLCVEGEPGHEVFILLTGDVKVLRRQGAEERLVSAEKAGGFIGELAVLDPAPRAATVLAGAGGTRVLRLAGSAFRDALKANPDVAQGVIRTLAQRLRGAQARFPTEAQRPPVAGGDGSTQSTISESAAKATR